MIGSKAPCAGAAFVAVCLISVLTHACGHGSSGSGNNNGGGGTTPPVGVSTSTPRPTVNPTVHPTGQTHAPGTATPTPTETAEPTPVPTVIVPSGENIREAAKSAPAGSTIIVSPGLYAAVAFTPGEIQDGITFFADVTGEFTGSAPDPVVIDARGAAAAFELSGQTGVTIDGFTLRGGRIAGILVRNSPGALIDDCVATANQGDGIQLQAADGGLLFNNLITSNGGAGISILATADLSVINNTVYNNANAGIAVERSSNVEVENSIINHNAPRGQGLVVNASGTGFLADFNLNTDGYKGTQAGPNDVDTDPLFLFPANGNPASGADFHLASGSGAIDAGDAAIDADLAATLAALTTQDDGTLDSPPPDMGYHYLPPQMSPTRPPRATATATPRSGTPTATRRPSTPTHGTATPTQTPTATTTPRGPHGGTATPRPTLTPRR